TRARARRNLVACSYINSNRINFTSKFTARTPKIRTNQYNTNRLIYTRGELSVKNSNQSRKKKHTILAAKWPPHINITHQRTRERLPPCIKIRQRTCKSKRAIFLPIPKAQNE
ncbi:hypothetical protein TorRG33x02_074160, partial [Trema orientale]